MTGADRIGQGQPARLPVGIAVPIVATLAGVYVISQFLRNSVGVIAPDLARELSLGAAQIGFLSSLFFLVFAAAQIPVGIAIDRYGPRAVMLASIALAVLGAVLFATGGSYAELLVARVFMGLGCATFLMAPLAVYARWFPPDRFSTLVGIQLGVGSLGTLIATAPLARTAEAVGWRPAFLGIAAASVLAALAIALVVRDDPPGAPPSRSRESLAQGVAGVVEALRTPDVARLFALHFTAYSIFASMLGLWGGPYLAHVYGFDLGARGDMLLALAAAQVAGVFAWGPSDRWFGSYRTPTLAGALAAAAAMLGLALAGTLPVALLWLWFVAFGAIAAFTPVMMAHGKALFPPRLVGRGITLMNLGTMAGVFVWQAITGAVMELFPARDGVYPLDAYRAVFALQGIALLAAAAYYAGARDPRRAQAAPSV